MEYCLRQATWLLVAFYITRSWLALWFATKTHCVYFSIVDFIRCASSTECIWEPKKRGEKGNIESKWTDNCCDMCSSQYARDILYILGSLVWNVEAFLIYHQNLYLRLLWAFLFLEFELAVCKFMCSNPKPNRCICTELASLLIQTIETMRYLEENGRRKNRE